MRTSNLNSVYSPILNLKLPAIGLGTSGYGGYFNEDYSIGTRKEYIDLLNLAYDNGVRVVDTAESYADGATEKIIGSLTSSIKDDLFIMSKFSPENSTSKGIINSLDGTLRRLKRDFVDVYMPHWPSLNLDSPAIIDTLMTLVDKKKIRFLGLSNFTLKKLNELNVLAKNKFMFFQAEYNPYERFIEKKLLPTIIGNNGLFIAYSPFRNGEILKPGSKYFEALKEIANNFSYSISELILLWVIRSKSVIAIPKSRSKIRLIENLKALQSESNEEALSHVSSLFELKIKMLSPELIKMEPDGDRVIYHSVSEAIINRFNLYPGPMEIAEEIKSDGGSLIRPIKVKKIFNSNNYVVCEGRLKFWAWIILYGYQRKIPCVIIN